LPEFRAATAVAVGASGENDLPCLLACANNTSDADNVFFWLKSGIMSYVGYPIIRYAPSDLLFPPLIHVWRIAFVKEFKITLARDVPSLKNDQTRDAGMIIQHRPGREFSKASWLEKPTNRALNVVVTESNSDLAVGWIGLGAARAYVVEMTDENLQEHRGFVTQWHDLILDFLSFQGSDAGHGRMVRQRLRKGLVQHFSAGRPEHAARSCPTLFHLTVRFVYQCCPLRRTQQDGQQ